MKTFKLGTGMLAAALAVLGCGETEDFAFETGTYAVSEAKLASANDSCGLLGAYTDPDKVIGVKVDGTTVTFNLSNDPQAAANTLPTSTLALNTLEVANEANYTIAFGDTCVTRVRRHVTGDVLEDNKAQLTLSFEVTKESGTCGADDTAFAAVPCTSAYTFVATKQDTTK